MATKANPTDTYLQEYAGLIRSALRIMKKRIERDGSTTPVQVAEAILRIPNVKNFLTLGNQESDIKRIAALIKSAALRGAFPGIQFQPKIGFREINLNIIAETDAELRLQTNVERAATAFCNHLGLKKPY